MPRRPPLLITSLPGVPPRQWPGAAPARHGRVQGRDPGDGATLAGLASTGGRG